MATLVSQILAAKGREVWSVRSTDSVYDALAELAEKGVGALVVVDDGDLVGILSERDYARKVILHGRDSASTRVSDIMTSDLFTVGPTQSVNDCMQLMTNHRIRHLPVVDEGSLVGVVSIGDVVKGHMTDQDVEIHYLKDYLEGKYPA